MTEAERQTLLQTLLGVHAYYDRDLSEMAVSVWLEDLAGHDMADVCAAFVRHRRDPERDHLPRR